MANNTSTIVVTCTLFICDEWDDDTMCFKWSRASFGSLTAEAYRLDVQISGSAHDLLNLTFWSPKLSANNILCCLQIFQDRLTTKLET